MDQISDRTLVDQIAERTGSWKLSWIRLQPPNKRKENVSEPTLKHCKYGSCKQFCLQSKWLHQSKEDRPNTSCLRNFFVYFLQA